MPKSAMRPAGHHLRALTAAIAVAAAVACLLVRRSDAAVPPDSAAAVKMAFLEPAAATEQPQSGSSGGRQAQLLYGQFGYQWEAFKAAFKKAYANSAEELDRLKIFVANLIAIEGHNRAADLGLKSYRLGVNQFADLSSEEFQRAMNGYSRLRRPLKSADGGTRRPGAIAYLSPAAGVGRPLPLSVDWRHAGAVTPVKDQGSCGSCWSFSATGALEGQHFRQTGSLVALSEQQLVDCSAGYGNSGCNGGLMDDAFKYAEKFGLEGEAAYPYAAAQATACAYNASRVLASCTGFVDLPAGSEAKLQEAVANVGPVSVAIDASHHSFQLYKDGIYDEPACSPSNLDHGVLVIGYGVSQSGAAYWLVKNSWNTHWGESGYIRIARNKSNMCGIASSACYPTV